jgi:ATP/maltotriose-dependent transcriptional regulator MalT
MEKKLTNSGPLRVPADKHSIYTMDKLSDQYRETVVQLGSKTDPATTSIAFAEAKLRAYIACAATKASLKKAEAELEQCLAETAPHASEASRVFQYISQTGALRSIIFLKTYGQLLQARGDAKQAEKIWAQAESRAKRAGLAHQLARMRTGGPRGYWPG